VPIAALLTELATRTEHEAMLRAERDATRVDAADRAVRDEDGDWADTLADGVDLEDPRCGELWLVALGAGRAG
jgi:hypothetical protein